LPSLVTTLQWGAGPAFRRSRLAKCDPPACAVSRSIARTFIATTRSGSAQTHGLTRSGSPIWSRASCARPAASEAPTFGRTSIGRGSPPQLWVIGSAVRPLRGQRMGV
jgi:hypothetical protein